MIRRCAVLSLEKLRWTLKAKQGPIRLPLPRQSKAMRGRKTLVLDLDETLIHSDIGHGNVVTTIFRPHLEEFLKEVHELFEVVVWTASDAPYGRGECSVIEKFIHQRFAEYVLDCRHTCVNSVGDGEYEFLKSLSELGRPMGNTLMLDESVRNFAFTPRCALRIERFDELLSKQPDLDRALLDVLPILKAVANAKTTAVAELDWWRPAGYEKLDVVNLNKVEPRTGLFTAKRLPAPIARSSDASLYV